MQSNPPDTLVTPQEGQAMQPTTSENVSEEVKLFNDVNGDWYAKDMIMKDNKADLSQVSDDVLNPFITEALQKNPNEIRTFILNTVKRIQDETQYQRISKLILAQMKAMRVEKSWIDSHALDLGYTFDEAQGDYVKKA